MLTRRNFLGALAGVAAGAAMPLRDALAAGQPAWPGPIGLELYTVRDLFARDPLGTLEKVAAIGYQLVEISPTGAPADFDKDLRASHLVAPSGYFTLPKTLDDWKRTVDQAHGYGLNYIVVGDNPKLNAAQWHRRADFFNQCGEVARQAAIQFCYHAHFHEFAKVDGTTGYDIMLKNCSPSHLQMEMDIFWVIYGGADPLHYWRTYPGRFPLLHIKDLRKGITIHHQEDPPRGGPVPFVPVGTGRIDWRRIFAHVEEAGAKHIFVEQDTCTRPELQAIKISYDYLRNLRLE